MKHVWKIVEKNLRSKLERIRYYRTKATKRNAQSNLDLFPSKKKKKNAENDVILVTSKIKKVIRIFFLNIKRRKGCLSWLYLYATYNKLYYTVGRVIS